MIEDNLVEINNGGGLADIVIEVDHVHGDTSFVGLNVGILRRGKKSQPT